MRHNFATLWLCAVAVITWPFATLSASNPSTCSDTPTICNSSNTCGGGPGTSCSVQVTRAGLQNGSVNIYLNGAFTPLQEFCVQQGSYVVWNVGDASSFAGVRFPNTTMFGKSSFTLDSINGYTATMNGTATGCYDFAVTSCSFDGTQCANTDPKVVIKGGQTRRRRQHK
jgi:hypothetical protein